MLNFPFKKARKSLIVAVAVTGVALFPLFAHALEKAAVGNKNAQAVNAFGMQLEATKAAIAAAMNDALARIALLEGRVDTLEITTENLDSRMTLAETEITDLKARVAVLESKMTVAEADIALLKAQVANLLVRVANLESLIAALTARVTTLEGEMSNVKTRLTIQEGEMVTAKVRISNLEIEVNVLKSRVTALENRMAAAEARLVPAGMISAFHAYSCPAGWSHASWLNGRTIVGTGGPYGYGLGSAGGSDFRTLTAWNLPQHAHAFTGYVSDQFVRLVDGSGQALYHNRAYTGYTSSCTDCGGGAFDNRMPFYAELYCYKN